MKINKLFILSTFLISSLISSCKKDNDASIDTEKPTISISAEKAFPKQCSLVKRGESFTVRAKLSDNVELGEYSIDIHQNFDHHSHSTEVQECQLGAKKAPVNPFLFIKSFTVPAGLKEFEAVQQINVPADADLGDYHFMIMVTDKSGWNSVIGLSIKIVE